MDVLRRNWQQSLATNSVISINLFYVDAIDDFLFESSFSGNSSDVTVTEEEILAKQQKKANWTIQPASVKQM